MKNIREVTLFPMNQNAEDLLMGAPLKVSDKQLKELWCENFRKKEIILSLFKLILISLNLLSFLHSCF